MSTAISSLVQLADAGDNALVGGKALNLGELIRAGFRVPGGFVVSTAAYKAMRGGGDGVPPLRSAGWLRCWTLGVISGFVCEPF